MQKSKKVVSLTLAAAMVAAGLVPSVSSKAAENDHSEFVTLNFYISNTPPADQERVMEKANEIIKEKINAELNLICVDPSTYAERINLMINSGEEFDLCFMGNWGGFNFNENASKGAFVDMKPLFEQYAPETYARIPEALWQGVTVNNGIYASVNYQQWGVAQRKGIALRWDLAEKYGFDWAALHGKPMLEVLKEIEPFLEQCVTEDSELVGWETSAGGSMFLQDPLYWDMDAVGGDTYQPGWVSYEDPTTVINQFETEEFEQFCNIMREYYEKGIVRKDGSTLQDTSPDRTAGRVVALWSYSWPDIIDKIELGIAPEGVNSMDDVTIDKYHELGIPTTGMSMYQEMDKPATAVTNTRTVIPATAGATACVAISSTSKHPERAMELIELLNTDDELFNLIQWGEEGVDYTWDEEGKKENVEGAYFFNYNEWQIGQSYSPDFARSDFKNWKSVGDDQKKACQVVFDADLTADPSPVTGFEFDPSPVKTELANCAAIITEVIPVLNNGAADPAEALPKFQQRLKDAGIDTIIAEKQAQLDAWNAAKAE